MKITLENISKYIKRVSSKYEILTNKQFAKLKELEKKKNKLIQELKTVNNQIVCYTDEFNYKRKDYKYFIISENIPKIIEFLENSVPEFYNEVNMFDFGFFILSYVLENEKEPKWKLYDTEKNEYIDIPKINKLVF